MQFGDFHIKIQIWVRPSTGNRTDAAILHGNTPQATINDAVRPEVTPGYNGDSNIPATGPQQAVDEGELPLHRSQPVPEGGDEIAVSGVPISADAPVTSASDVDPSVENVPSSPAGARSTAEDIISPVLGGSSDAGDGRDPHGEPDNSSEGPPTKKSRKIA